MLGRGCSGPPQLTCFHRELHARREPALFEDRLPLVRVAGRVFCKPASGGTLGLGEPMGFGGEFHETGIALPEPGRAWKAVRLEEGATVQA